MHFLFLFISTILSCINPIFSIEFTEPVYCQKINKSNKTLKIKITQGNTALKLVKPKHQASLQTLHLNAQAMQHFMYHGKPRSQQSFLRIFSNWCQKPEKDDPFTAYTFWDTQKKKFIGYIGLESCAQNAVEVCYAILPEFWNQGYGKALLKTGCTVLINFLKQQGYIQKYNITHLVAHVCVANQASAHLLKKNGFQPIEKSLGDDSPTNWIKVQKNL